MYVCVWCVCGVCVCGVCVCVCVPDLQQSSHRRFRLHSVFRIGPKQITSSYTYNNCHRPVHHTPANTFKVDVLMKVQSLPSKIESTEAPRNPPHSCFTSCNNTAEHRHVAHTSVSTEHRSRVVRHTGRVPTFRQSVLPPS